MKIGQSYWLEWLSFPTSSIPCSFPLHQAKQKCTLELNEEDNATKVWSKIKEEKMGS